MTSPSAPNPRPGPRIRGMLGPDTSDALPSAAGAATGILRSDIDEFTVDDASSVLDGDVGLAESRRIARLVATGRWRGSLPHGGHRYATGWGKSEFPYSWSEPEVIDWVNALVDVPSAVRAQLSGRGILLAGRYRGTAGVLVIANVTTRSHFIVTAYPSA